MKANATWPKRRFKLFLLLFREQLNFVIISLLVVKYNIILFSLIREKLSLNLLCIQCTVKPLLSGHLGIRGACNSDLSVSQSIV